MVRPSSASAWITRRTSPTSSGSSEEVGSSNNSTSGSIASARAIATRCCCPPESFPRIRMELVLQPYLRQLFGGTRARRLLGRALHRDQSFHDVLEHGHVWEQ